MNEADVWMTLYRRHLEFLVKYQAEMDRSEPRSVEVLIQELKREELKKKELEGKASFVTKLSPWKSTDSAMDNQVCDFVNRKRSSICNRLSHSSQYLLLALPYGG